MVGWFLFWVLFWFFGLAMDIDLGIDFRFQKAYRKYELVTGKYPILYLNSFKA